MNPIAIMQGRLSPPPPDRIQAFPWDSWEHEFIYARQLGLDRIEWVFEDENHESNPVWTSDGVKRIMAIAESEGVAVKSVCADYFMPHPFFRVTAEERAKSIQVLERLIQQGAEVGIEVILIPVVEIAEVRSDEDRRLLLDSVRQCLPLARQHGVSIGFETELPAEQYESLIKDFNDDGVAVYYDTGNAAFMGYDTAVDIRRLGPLLCGVHIKDRPVGGSTVPLGEGDVDFAALFSALRQVGYGGHYTLQPYFDADFLGYARRHVSFVRDGLEAAREVAG